MSGSRRINEWVSLGEICRKPVVFGGENHGFPADFPATPILGEENVSLRGLRGVCILTNEISRIMN